MRWFVLLCVTVIGVAHADETCNSPYISQLIKGQEDYVYVWTLGVEGLGDGSDKLVTIDVNPKSKRYGKVISKVSTGRRVEAHHMGFTDDRRYLWAGGLSDNRIWVFDVGRNPAAPKLVRTIDDLGEKSGFLGPHTYYALPGRILVQALSNTQDKGGRTGMALYNNKGEFIASYAMPTEGGGDGYGYDLAVNPKQNALLTSSFTGYANYMRPLGELIKDAEAMKKFGNSMVLWNLKTMKPAKVFAVPGAPLEIRWSLNPKDNWAITAAALTSKLWLVKQDAKGQWAAKEVGTLGELIKDAEAMKKFGNSMVLWNLKTMKPAKVFAVPGAPLEIRWSLNPKDNWAITAAALTSKLWLVKQDAKGQWAAKEVGTVGDTS